jgi:hypothetical protein
MNMKRIAVTITATATPRRASSRTRKPSSADVQKANVQTAKQTLKQVVSTTNRGGTASSSQRGAVEEAQITLENLSLGSTDISSSLPGKWRVVYTTAPDVAPLLAGAQFGRFSPLRAGNIYQEFFADGRVKNIIQASVPYLLQEGAGVTAVVTARWEVKSGRRIALTFEEAGVGEVKISKELESFLAPALLPRSWLTHRLLLAIKEFSVNVPLRRGLPTGLQQNADRLVRNVGSEYLLTYLDDEILIGRQTGTGGTFIFEKE